jgi:gamma-glutamyltranspeptidase
MSYVPPPHTTQHWLVGKPGASGRRGMVASQARGAAEAGVAVLDAGGNAIDAAVATALALHRAGQPTAEVVDFGPVAPRRLSPANFRLTGRMTDDLFAWPEVEGDANIHGPLSFAIPSSVAGYHRLHAEWGRLPLAEVIGPAIGLARRGLPQDWFTTVKIATTAATLRRYAESARICRTACRARPSRAVRLASSPSAASPTRWSGFSVRACATITRATSPPASRPTWRRWAACWTARICGNARRASCRRCRCRGGAGARCSSPPG